MGSSQRKKKEKKQDFQKAKLKVGKPKPKASNYTDTSFRSKAIVLNQQSLSTSAPSANAQFNHHLSLLNSKSDSQRRDALAYLSTSIASRPVDSPLPQPVSVILPPLQPLVLDVSTGVRTQLLKLLKVLPETDLEGHAPQILPYLRAGMTHLSADIRLSSIDMMSWLISTCGDELVSCAGGWVKTMNCFLSMLGWHTVDSLKWSSQRASFGKAGTEGRPMTKMLLTFADFLHAGVCPTQQQYARTEWAFPLCQTVQHLIPRKSAPYAYLNLFGARNDEEDGMYEAREDRIRILGQRFLHPIKRGVAAAKREGGETGRASASVTRVLKEAGLHDDL